MKNKLFLICPDSQIEPFIRKEYGGDVFFLTALGTVFNFQEFNYAEELRDLLQRKAIEEIFIVTDTSCRFMNSILEQEKGFGTKAEGAILNLFIDNYYTIMAGASEGVRKQNLAKLNIQRQALDILSHEVLLTAIAQSQIRLKGLITSKAKGKLEEVDVSVETACK